MMTTLTCAKCGTKSRKKHENWNLIAAYSRWLREGWTAPKRGVEMCPSCS